LRILESTEKYCKHFKVLKPNFEDVGLSRILRFPDYFNSIDRLLNNVNEFIPVLHNKKTFMGFLEQAGFQGRRESELLKQLNNSIVDFIPLMKNFDNFLTNKAITITNKERRQGFPEGGISFSKISDEHKQWVKILETANEFINKINLLIEDVKQANSALLGAVLEATRDMENKFHKLQEDLKRAPGNEDLLAKKQVIFRDAETLQRIENHLKHDVFDEIDSKDWDRLQKIYL